MIPITEGLLKLEGKVFILDREVNKTINFQIVSSKISKVTYMVRL